MTEDKVKRPKPTISQIEAAIQKGEAGIVSLQERLHELDEKIAKLYSLLYYARFGIKVGDVVHSTDLDKNFKVTKINPGALEHKPWVTGLVELKEGGFSDSRVRHLCDKWELVK